jgi:hypothetical protein
MTEAEWLACGDPMKMYPVVKPPLSRRVAALFGAACISATPGAEEQPLLQRVVEAVERSVDGGSMWEDVDLLHREAESACGTVELDSAPHFWALVAYRLTDDAVARCWMHVPFFLVKAISETDAPAAHRNNRVYADFLRDVAGNPFRGGRGRRLSRRARKPQPGPLIRAGWLTATVLAFAGEADEARDFSALPVLADALDDAGCDNADILGHLRSAGPHVRGCWALDLLLNRA